ncbi:Transcription factor WhiB [Brevibacterium casei CIP 102111]|uniref:Transcription factor WhiB n=2 Tax=Brevibacterium casei TaxID=33889 RepID=A0A2H1I396_9MICO|nr:WhiB family transcriptional regulator [Brevibacterium casei]QPR40765.1 WhiB family transcriptional regulator [Brevibacterium casei]QPR44920.1 WhiB family transcriptional regulator [Brevibacterium casei]SMX69699.1 Transcription factor WhiB [Brevibacterium casei CIP 102111]
MDNRRRAHAALAPLLVAMETDRPACEGDERFIDDRIRQGGGLRDRIDMRQTCRSCPLLELCQEFATTARPEAGFWAGKWRGGEPRPLSRNGGDPL